MEYTSIAQVRFANGRSIGPSLLWGPAAVKVLPACRMRPNGPVLSPKESRVTESLLVIILKIVAMPAYGK